MIIFLDWEKNGAFYLKVHTSKFYDLNDKALVFMMNGEGLRIINNGNTEEIIKSNERDRYQFYSMIDSEEAFCTEHLNSLESAVNWRMDEFLPWEHIRDNFFGLVNANCSCPKGGVRCT